MAYGRTTFLAGVFTRLVARNHTIYQPEELAGRTEGDSHAVAHHRAG